MRYQVLVLIDQDNNIDSLGECIAQFNDLDITHNFADDMAGKFYYGVCILDTFDKALDFGEGFVSIEE